MGMDVYAYNPTNPENDYFRANCWGWRPIHSFMSSACSHVYGAAVDNSMSVNDGKGISPWDTEYCAELMQKSLDAIKTNKPELIENVVKDGETIEVFVPYRESDPEWADDYKVPLWRLQDWINFVKNSNGFQVH